MYQNNLNKVSYSVVRSLNELPGKYLLPQFQKKNSILRDKKTWHGTGNFNNIILAIPNRNYYSLLNKTVCPNSSYVTIKNINNTNSFFNQKKKRASLCQVDLKKNSLITTVAFPPHIISMRHFYSQPQSQLQPELFNHIEEEEVEEEDEIQGQVELISSHESVRGDHFENSNDNRSSNDDSNNNSYNNSNSKTNNNDSNNEEAEDELNILLSTKDNFFVREWKELKSFAWHLVFGSQVLVHEAQQALELKQKRIDNIPLTRRESLLIRRSFHDTLCVIPFFIFLAIEPYYLFLLTSIFPSLVPSVYVTPHILKKNLEKNKKHRRRIAKSAAKLTPWVPFNVQVLKDEKNLYHLSKNEFKQLDIDSLSWWHLKSCAGYLGIYGMLPKTVLKIRIDEYFDYIKSDDEFIHAEGIDSLTLEELRLANEQRGFNSLGLSKQELAENLRHWIHFFSSEENREIPRIVLLLSHIYSDNIKFQAEARQRKAYRKQRRQALLHRLTHPSLVAKENDSSSCPTEIKGQ